MDYVCECTHDVWSGVFVKLLIHRLWVCKHPWRMVRNASSLKCMSVLALTMYTIWALRRSTGRVNNCSAKLGGWLGRGGECDHGVFVCVCVCVCACVGAHAHTHVHPHTFECKHVSVSMCIHVCACLWKRERVYVFVWECVLHVVSVCVACCVWCVHVNEGDRRGWLTPLYYTYVFALVQWQKIWTGSQWN